MLFWPEADLVTAADVFIYVGALEKVVNKIAGMLAGGGLFAFSVETLACDGLSDSAGFALQPSRRYAHSQGYVERVLDADGFSILSLQATIIRQDRREPVEGLAVVASLLSGSVKSG